MGRGGGQRPETYVTANPMFEVLIRANCFVRNEELHIWDLLALVSARPQGALFTHRAM